MVEYFGGEKTAQKMLLNKIRVVSKRGRINDNFTIGSIIRNARAEGMSIPHKEIKEIMKKEYPKQNPERAKVAYELAFKYRGTPRGEEYEQLGEKFALKSKFPHFMCTKLEDFVYNLLPFGQ